MLGPIIEYFCLNRKFLIYNLVLRNLKVRYRKSFFGLFWTLLIPACSAGIYFLVFNYILKVQVPNYLLHILSGLIPWAYFTSSLASLEVVAANHELLGKIPLPPQALVLAESLTHFLNLVLSLPILIIAILLHDLPLSLTLLQYPLLALILGFTVHSTFLILSLGYVYFRDLKYLVPLVLQFGFYLTPIMYDIKMIPEQYRGLLGLNPMGHLFSAFHKIVVAQEWVPLTDWGIILGWSAVLSLLAFALYKKVRYSVVELL